MDATKILKAFLKADREQPHTPSETRLFFTLLGLFQERANEQGQFAATLDEVCKRYGTTYKKHIRQTRETLCKKGMVQYFVTDRKPCIYTFVDGYKNIPIQGYKNIPIQGYKNVPVYGYKNIPTKERKKAPVSSTHTTQESKIFEASTPFGKIQYHTEEAAKNAPVFCKNAMDLFCTKYTLKEIQKFCLYWLKEDEITKQPLHQTKTNFSLSDEFKQFQEK